MIYILIIFFFVILLYFLIKPNRPTTDQLAPLNNRNYAHRGLHKKDKSIPENSLKAFKEAVSHGYGIELDLQFSKDRKIVVFHDNTLERVCGVLGKVSDYTYDELQQFSLCNTTERIPLFTEVLQLVNGKVPLIVELKSCKNRSELCEASYNLLKSYHGDYCIESFDPFIVRWFYLNAPSIVRGQLSRCPKKLRKELAPLPAFFLGNLLSNFLCRPNFIAYEKESRSILLSLSYTLGATKAVWTIRDTDIKRRYELENSMVIFEFYLPPARYDKE